MMSEPITDAEILEWEATAQSMAWFTVTDTEFFVITRTVLNRLIAEVRRCWKRAEQAEAERDKYVQLYGCLSCGEVHDGICPPHEVRTTGMAALRTPQALRAENAALRQRVGEAEKLSVRLYSQGYGRGHDDTVEGVYIDVLPCDEETYFQDEVLCITRKVADAARKGKE